MTCTRSRLLVATALLIAALPALAQDRIQQRMSAEEFRAMGLDTLDPAQLARLDAWFARQMTDTAEASTSTSTRFEPARAQRVDESPVDSTLVGMFPGFGQGREFTLANGQVWRQTDATQLPGVTLEAPRVEIRPARLGGWWMRVNEYNTRAKVERVR